MIIRPSIMLLMLCLAYTEASAQNITTCKEPEGKRYVVGVGWVEDGITGGETTLTKTEQGYDLIIKSRGGDITATGDGAVVVPSEIIDDAMSLIVAYPHAIETYVFDFNDEKMIFTSTKISMGAKTAALFVADCAPN